jgi:hypothetical protein
MSEGVVVIDAKPKLTFTVKARRISEHGSQADCKSATITLDTDLAGISFLRE